MPQSLVANNIPSERPHGKPVWLLLRLIRRVWREAVIQNNPPLGGSWGEPLTRRAARDIAHIRLRQLILAGQLEPGTCVPESELASRVGVGRTPLREGIKALEMQGLVSRLTNGRLMITPLTATNLRGLYAVRAALEVLIVKTVATEASSVAMGDTLQPIISRIRSYLEGSGDEVVAEGDRFHYALAEICTNEVAKAVIQQLRDRIAIYRRVGTAHDPARFIEAAKEHIVIYELIACRQPDQAAARMEEHIRRGQEVVLRYLYGLG